MAQADLHEQLKPSTYLMSVRNGIEVKKKARSCRVGGGEFVWERLCCSFLGGRARSVGLVWVWRWDLGLYSGWSACVAKGGIQHVLVLRRNK